MKRLLIILLLSASFQGIAQAVFISSGTILYERKINVRRQVTWEGFQEALKTEPTFHTSYFELSFSEGRSVYQLAEKLPDFKFPWILGPAKENVVRTDFQTGMSQTTKAVFEQTFLIADSLSNLKWRITDEKREIAGFSCRKAVAKILDSVYITAFYTEEIIVSGGPESFHGLPGMILGLAVPRLYTTWFATKLSLEGSKLPEPKISSRQKKVDNNKLLGELKPFFKQWGSEGQKYMWWIFL